MNAGMKRICESPFSVRVCESGLESETSSRMLIARIGKEIRIDLGKLKSYLYEGFTSLHYDLLIVCAAVEFADRAKGRSVRNWARLFDLHVPVHNVTLWETSQVKESLIEALRHLTGDNWCFSFTQAYKSPFEEAYQLGLPFHDPKDFVIPYSDGLDSRCVSGLQEKEGCGIRVRVSRHKEQGERGEHPFDRIPFIVSLRKAKEHSVRSRGFKFAAIASIAAHIGKAKRIVMPESGQGALGPILAPIFRVYPDYRHHPTFFRRIEIFLRSLFGASLTFEQPRLWYTKAETISQFLSHAGHTSDSLVATRSCWQQRWNANVDGKRRQCGLCAACLLRRMSLHAAGVQESPSTYAISDLSKASYDDAAPRGRNWRESNSMREYGLAGARHLDRLRELANSTDSKLEPHILEIALSTGLHEHQVGKRLIRLLKKHAEEWEAFLRALGSDSFVNRWMVGGRSA